MSIIPKKGRHMSSRRPTAGIMMPIIPEEIYQMLSSSELALYISMYKVTFCTKAIPAAVSGRYVVDTQ